MEEKPDLTAAKELIAYIRKAEEPCLSPTQTALVTHIQTEIRPTLTDLLNVTMTNSNLNRSLEDVDLLPYTTLVTEYKNKLAEITINLPNNMDRSVGVALLQLLFEEYFGKGEDADKERSLIFWVNSGLFIYNSDGDKYSKWNV